MMLSRVVSIILILFLSGPRGLQERADPGQSSSSSQGAAEEQLQRSSLC